MPFQSIKKHGFVTGLLCNVAACGGGNLSRQVFALLFAGALAAAGASCGGGKPVATPPTQTTVSSSQTWSWQQVSTISFSYRGGVLSNGLLDSPDGSKLFIFSGPDPTADLPLAFKVVKVTPAGTLQDVTDSAMPAGASGAVHARRMVVGDLNGDGIPDFFSANHGFDQPPFPGEKNSLFLSTPSGAFVDASSSLPPIMMFTHSTAIGDIRRSGALDLLVGGLGMQQNIGLPAQFQGPNTAGPNNDLVGPYILRGNGHGAFTYDNISLPAKVANNFLADGIAPGRFTAALFVDVNGDGFLDLVFGSDETSDRAGNVFMNDGAGRFVTPEHLLPTGLFGAKNTITVDIEALDINSDGRPDLVLSQVPNSPVFYGAGRIQVLINQGDGTFADQTATYIPTAAPNQRWTQFLKFFDMEMNGCNSIFLQTDLPVSGDFVALRCDAPGVFHVVSRNELPTSLSSFTPLRIGTNTYILTALGNGSTMTVTLFQRK